MLNMRYIVQNYENIITFLNNSKKTYFIFTVEYEHSIQALEICKSNGLKLICMSYPTIDLVNLEFSR